MHFAHGYPLTPGQYRKNLNTRLEYLDKVVAKQADYSVFDTEDGSPYAGFNFFCIWKCFSPPSLQMRCKCIYQYIYRYIYGIYGTVYIYRYIYI